MQGKKGTDDRGNVSLRPLECLAGVFRSRPRGREVGIAGEMVDMLDHVVVQILASHTCRAPGDSTETPLGTEVCTGRWNCKVFVIHVQVIAAVRA